MTTFSKRIERRRFYEAELLREMPRLLSRMDRCPESASRGCMDREYWGWATKDFANMDMQRGVLALAYLFKKDFPGNIYHGEKAVLEWLRFGVTFWIRNQYPDGSFDHLYPRERSWMATAFTLVDMLEAYGLVANDLDAEFCDAWLNAMRRAGTFIVENDETHGFISNHRAGAAAALLGLSIVTSDATFKQHAWRLMDDVYSRQSDEGWFLEYEGADPGYQTLDTHYQALFYLYSGSDSKVLHKVRKSLEFLEYFVHPDGSVGGEYGSRNCPHYFPGGFELFASQTPIAGAIAAHAVRGLAEGNACGLADSDGRNSAPLVTSYVYAHRVADDVSESKEETPQLPFERLFERAWPRAGLYVRSDEHSYSIFGASKGGTIKVFDKSELKLAYSSCGYAGVTADNKHVTTHLYTDSPEFSAGGLECGGEKALSPARRVEVDAPFFEFRPDRTMSKAGFIIFRLFNMSAGRVPPLNRFARKQIISRFLFARKKRLCRLHRVLEFNNGSYTIEDVIESGGEKFKELKEHGYFSTVYMASARYFRRQDFVHAWSSPNLAVAGFAGGRLSRTIMNGKRKLTENEQENN